MAKKKATKKSSIGKSKSSAAKKVVSASAKKVAAKKVSAKKVAAKKSASAKSSSSSKKYKKKVGRKPSSPNRYNTIKSYISSYYQSTIGRSVKRYELKTIYQWIKDNYGNQSVKYVVMNIDVILDNFWREYCNIYPVDLENHARFFDWYYLKDYLSEEKEYHYPSDIIQVDLTAIGEDVMEFFMEDYLIKADEYYQICTAAGIRRFDYPMLYLKDAFCDISKKGNVYQYVLELDEDKPSSDSDAKPNKPIPEPTDVTETQKGGNTSKDDKGRSGGTKSGGESGSDVVGGGKSGAIGGSGSGGSGAIGSGSGAVKGAGKGVSGAGKGAGKGVSGDLGAGNAGKGVSGAGKGAGKGVSGDSGGNSTEQANAQANADKEATNKANAENELSKQKEKELIQQRQLLKDKLETIKELKKLGFNNEEIKELIGGM